MRSVIIAGLIAATIGPVAVSAQIDRQDRTELRQDRRDVRQQRQELDQAYRNGTNRDIRRERGDLRDARQEYRHDYRDARGEGYASNRYDRGNYGPGYSAPFAYRSFRSGYRIAPSYYAPRYYINDWSRFGLARPGYGQRWVRHYNDLLLVNTQRGVVVRVFGSYYR